MTSTDLLCSYGGESAFIRLDEKTFGLSLVTLMSPVNSH